MNKEQNELKRYECLNCAWQSSNKPDKMKCPDCGSVVYSHEQKVEVKKNSSLMSEDEFQKKWAFPRSSFDFSNPVTFTKSVQALMHLKEDERKILEELIWMWEENRFKK